MVQRVDLKYHLEGQFTDKKTNQLKSYDKTHFVVARYDEQGQCVGKPSVASIDTIRLQDEIEVGDFVEVFNNAYGQPAMVVLVQKGG